MKDALDSPFQLVRSRVHGVHMILPRTESTLDVLFLHCKAFSSQNGTEPRYCHFTARKSFGFVDSIFCRFSLYVRNIKLIPLCLMDEWIFYSRNGESDAKTSWVRLESVPSRFPVSFNIFSSFIFFLKFEALRSSHSTDYTWRERNKMARQSCLAMFVFFLFSLIVPVPHPLLI